MSGQQRSRIVGIDYGIKRIGIAVSDESKMIASPVMTLEAAKRSEDTVAKVLEALEKIADSNKCVVEEVVLGLPLKMNGSASLLADEVTHFVELLRKHITIPVTTWDERLTSVQAERSLKEAKMSRKRRTKVVDAVAAVIILQSYLDSKFPGLPPIT